MDIVSSKPIFGGLFLGWEKGRSEGSLLEDFKGTCLWSVNHLVDPIRWECDDTKEIRKKDEVNGSIIKLSR